MSGGILILDRDERLVGIVTTRDLLFENNDERAVSELMRRDVVTAPPNTTMEEAEKILHGHRIEKLPLVDDSGRVIGLITMKDIMKMMQYPRATKDARGRLTVGAAVGVREKELQRDRKSVV